MSRTQRTKNGVRTSEKQRRREILSMARHEARQGNHDTARALFALVGVDYDSPECTVDVLFGGF